MMDGTPIPLKEEQFGKIRVKRVSLEPKGIWKSVPLRYVYENLYNALQDQRILIDSARGEKFDLIHGHDVTIFGSSALKLSKMLKKPLIIELHVTGGYHPGALRSLFVFYLMRIAKILESCDLLITLTQALKNYIIAQHNLQEEKIKIVPNGVDPETFNPQRIHGTELDKLKEKLDLSDGKVVMYSGYIDKTNGIIDFTDMIPSLIREEPDLSFIFIGNGPERERVVSFSKKYSQIKYISMVPYHEMPLYYQLCDIFVVPRPHSLSAELITPLKILEAMAMEKTILGSDVGGISEVVKAGENGYLFEKGNMGDFKEVLLKIIRSDSDKICKNARKTIVNNYTWERSSSYLEGIYEDLIE